MAIGLGFSKTVTDGLLFGYDTGDQRNLYRGQPGTNIAYGPNRSYNGYSITNYSNGKLFETNGYTETVDIPLLGRTSVETVEIYNVYSGYGTDGNFNCCPNLFNYSPSGWNSTTWESSTTYTYQIIYKTTSGYTHPNYMYHYEYAANGTYLTEYGVHDTSRREELGNGWYHAWGTFTTQAGAATGYLGFWHYEYNTRNKVSVAAISLVKGSTIRPPLQFINEGTTLSASSSLLDMKRTAAIDLSNISFSSTGDVEFDGTNDSISIPTSGEMYCLEMVWYNNNAITNNESAIGGPSTYQTPISWNGTSNGVHLGGWTGALSNEAIHIWNGGGATSTKTARPVGYHHVLFNWNGSSYDIWVDGDKEITYPLSGTTHAGRVTLSSALRVGGDPDNYFFNGKVPVVKAYSRSLTASEIMQNFATYKSRFKIVDTYRYYEGANATPFLQYWNNSTTYTMADFGGIPNVTAHGWSSGPATYTLTLTQLPPHSQVRYKVFWHCVDSVDNETNQLFIGDGSSELEILRFTKLYNAAPSISVLNAKSEAPWSGSKTYTYRPWANGGYNADGYLLVDSGWIDFSGNTFTARHVLGADQPQSDEAMYLSHVEVLLRY
jgi:hypothetical protein